MNAIETGASATGPPRVGVRGRWTAVVAGGGLTLTLTLALALAACGTSSVVTGTASPRTSTVTTEAQTRAEPATAPDPSSVVDGRFVRPVELDGGTLLVDPPGAGAAPTVSETDAADAIWASSTFSGHRAGVIGFGVVTISLAPSGPGAPAVTAMPAWVGFGVATAYSCPAESVPSGVPSTLPALPTDGYAAVVLGEGDVPLLAYTARSSICGSAPTGPSYGPTDEVQSVPWTAVGALHDGSLTVRAEIPGCGVFQGASSGGTRTTWTISILALVPRTDAGCTGSSVTETLSTGPVGDPGAPPPVVSSGTAITHAALGLVRQAS